MFFKEAKSVELMKWTSVVSIESIWLQPFTFLSIFANVSKIYKQGMYNLDLYYCFDAILNRYEGFGVARLSIRKDGIQRETLLRPSSIDISSHSNTVG